MVRGWVEAERAVVGQQPVWLLPSWDVRGVDSMLPSLPVTLRETVLLRKYVPQQRSVAGGP